MYILQPLLPAPYSNPPIDHLLHFFDLPFPQVLHYED